MKNEDGIFDKYGMIDNIFALLNSVTVSGSKNVIVLSNVFSMLSTLNKGLKDEENAKNKTIELLKMQLKRTTEPQIEDGGDVIGGETFNLNFGGADNGKD